MAKVKGAILAKQILGKLWGGTRAVGRGGRKLAVVGTAGAIGLGVNPFLGAGLGKLLGGMGGGGKGSLGAGGGILGAGGGTVGPGAGRDSSIVAGMQPHSPMKQINVGTLKPNADFRSLLTYAAKSSQATYLTTLQNNKELIYIQKMLQGPTAARAKELRMESARGGGSLVVVAPGGGGQERGGGLGLPMLAAAIAGLLGGALAGAARDGPVTGGGAADILDKAWWDKPNNKYLGKRGTYWERLKAARFMSDFATEEYKVTRPKPKLGDALKKWRAKITGGLGVEGGDPFTGDDRWMRRSAAAEALAKRGGVSRHGVKLPYTYKLPLSDNQLSQHMGYWYYLLASLRQLDYYHYH